MTEIGRISLTLPADVADDLTYIASRIGVSRSSLVADMLGEPASDLRALLEEIPLSPSETDVLRFRGRSKTVISERLDGLRRMEDDLFSD